VHSLYLKNTPTSIDIASPAEIPPAFTF
jgi:hypothetical protein